MMEVAKWLVIAHAVGSVVVALILLSAAAYFAARWFAQRGGASNAAEPRSGHSNS